mgnify:CR=1 FL=1
MYIYFIIFILIIIYLYTCNNKDNFAINKNNNLNSLKQKKYRFAVIYTEKRLPYIEKLEKDINLTLEKWPAVFTKSCPRNQNYSLYAKKFCTTCRGLSIAHREIWDDFVNSEADYILIFEDDAEVESLDKLDEIYDKLNNINSDITYLGHCYGHLCLHAYVLTKDGAKILLENIKTCGAAIDEQVSQLVQDKYIESEIVKNPGEKSHWTQGYFHQIGKTDGDGSLQTYKDYEKIKK